MNKATMFSQWIITLLIVFLFAPPVISGDWHDEFEELCSKVQTAESLTLEEINSLIERVDTLLPKIEASDDPKKKVYIFRLKKCRAFFEYIIELKKSGRAEQ